MSLSFLDNRVRLGRAYLVTRRLFPGLLASGTVAMAANFLSSQYQAPVMLFALLLGMAFYFLSEQGPCSAGIDFAATPLLRLGVALLGARVTFEQILSLGVAPVVIVVASVLLTIVMGLVLAWMFGLSSRFGVLSGGAVAICGASAALALAAVLPKNKQAARDASFVIISVTTLSTIAMVLYPIIVRLLELNPTMAGLFLGGTIHDVAQVVGAGYSVSETTGDIATITKLLRVALLVPVVAAIALWVAVRRRSESRSEMSGVPLFLIGFIVLAAAGSLGVIPSTQLQFLSDVSRWFLVTAIAAIGMKTSLRTITSVGLRSVTLVVAETVFLAFLVLVLLAWLM